MSARLSASVCEAADSPPDEDGPAVLMRRDVDTELRAVLAAKQAQIDQEPSYATPDWKPTEPTSTTHI